MTALGEQTVTVPGSAAADTVLPELADSLKTVLQQRNRLPSRSRGYLMRTLLPGS